MPGLWLFTDERMDGCPLAAARALPPRSGIVFRHYATLPREREQIFRRLRSIARARGHVILYAGDETAARRNGANGAHRSLRRNRRDAGARPFSISVHDAREACVARRSGARIVFISPVFATRSHRAGTTLGIRGFARLARLVPLSAIALGGMTENRFRTLRGHGAHGWAAIDALSRT